MASSLGLRQASLQSSKLEQAGDQRDGNCDENERPGDEKGREGENRDDHRGRQRRSPPTRSGPAHAPAPRETAARESSRAAPPAGCRWDRFIRGAGPGPAPLAPTRFGLRGWVEIRAGATH